MKLFIYIILLTSISITLLAQNRSRSLLSLNDSLKHKLELTNNDSLKAEILMKISENFLYSNPDSVIIFGEKAMNMAEKANNVEVQNGSMGFIGDALINKGNLPKALEIGFRTIELGENLPVRVSGIGPTYSNMGNIYFQIEDYEKAFKYFNKMIGLGSADLVGVAYGNYEKAKVYEKINRLDSALTCLDNSYKTFSTIEYSTYQNVYDFYPAWYILRAKVYFKQKKLSLALNDFFFALKSSLKNNQSLHISNSFNEISNYYKSMNQPDSAIIYARRGLAEADKISYTQGILYASEILAELFEDKDPGEALYYLKLAIQTRNKFYGAGNIQVMKDMIEQNENKQREINEAKADFQNKLKLYLLLAGISALAFISILLFRNNRQKQNANNLLKRQKEETEIQKKYVETQNKIINAENERKTIEMEEARQLQISMLPKKLPQLPNLDIAVYMQTATEVGGDYYDFSVKEDKTLNIGLGDATGHGMKAGTLVTMMKSLFTGNSVNTDIEEFFVTSNKALKNSMLQRMMFAFLMINVNRSKITMVNAGMPPLYFYKADKKEVQEISMHGLPLGAMKKSIYECSVLTVAMNDVILMVTDGLPELQNSNNEMYGYERLKEVFKNNADNTADEIINVLKDEGSNWMVDKDPEDDVSFIVVKFK